MRKFSPNHVKSPSFHRNIRVLLKKTLYRSYTQLSLLSQITCKGTFILALLINQEKGIEQQSIKLQPKLECANSFNS